MITLAFDPNSTEIRTSDTRVPVDAPIDGFMIPLLSLSEELDILTNKAKSQLKERHTLLLEAEASLLKSLSLDASAVESGLASDPQRTRFFANAIQLDIVRKDLVDTSESITMMEVDDVDAPSNLSWSPETVLVVD